MNTFEHKFARLKFLFRIGLAGIPFGIASAILGETIAGKTTMVIAILLAVPVFIYFYCLTILHWKARYRGAHSDFWGIILLIETSGWFKLIYLFRHILPDIRKTGRYEIEIANQALDGTA